MYPRVVRCAVGDLRPVLSCNVLIEKTNATKNGTGLVSAKFFMAPLDDLGTLKINGAAAVITTANPLVLSYTFVGTDTDTADNFAGWFVGYWGAASTVPETFDGFEVQILAAGKRLVY
jgi:hypothetical protein